MGDGTVYQYRYDAFGRMVKVYQRNATRYAGSLISHYRYDGLGQRVGWRSNSTGITSSDPWFHFVYDDRWRIIETFRGNSGHTARDTYPKERFVMHNAGRDGLGGSSYIDTLAWMDRDLSVDWRSAAGDNDLETRHYYCQNWRADTVVLLGKMTLGTTPEWLPQRHYRYSAYGRRVEVAPDDFNQDGFVDWFDLDDLESLYSTQARSDLTFDGVLDASYYGYDDETLYDMIADGTKTEQGTGGGVRTFYAGYQVDPSTVARAIGNEVLLVRYRVLLTLEGKWCQADPLGVDAHRSLSAYARSSPVTTVDTFGQAACAPCASNDQEKEDDVKNEVSWWSFATKRCLWGARSQAEAVGKKYPGIERGMGDAMRHCTLTCGACICMGDAWARRLGRAHERTTPYNPTLDRDWETWAEERYQDLHNNEWGISVCRDLIVDLDATNRQELDRFRKCGAAAGPGQVRPNVRGRSSKLYDCEAGCLAAYRNGRLLDLTYWKPQFIKQGPHIRIDPSAPFVRPPFFEDNPDMFVPGKSATPDPAHKLPPPSLPPGSPEISW